MKPVNPLFAAASIVATTASLVYGQHVLQTLPALPDGTLPLWQMREDGQTFTHRTPALGYRLRNGIVESNPSWYFDTATSDDGEVWTYTRPRSVGGWELWLNDRGTQRLLNSGYDVRVQHISGDGTRIAYQRREQSFSDWFNNIYATTPSGPSTFAPMHAFYGSGEPGGTWPMDFRVSYNGRSWVESWSSGAPVLLSQEGTGGVPFGPPPRPEPPPTGYRFETSFASLFSRDGRVLIGTYGYQFGFGGMTSGNFIYTRETGTQWAPQSLTNFISSLRTDTLSIPGDGQYILRTTPASAQFPAGLQRLYRFSDQAVLSLNDFLTQSGVDFTNWTDLVTTTWSIDGRVISGTGRHEFAPGQFRNETWFVTIPSPGTCMFAFAGALFAARRRR